MEEGKKVKTFFPLTPALLSFFFFKHLLPVLHLAALVVSATAFPSANMSECVDEKALEECFLALHQSDQRIMVQNEEDSANGYQQFDPMMFVMTESASNLIYMCE